MPQFDPKLQDVFEKLVMLCLKNTFRTLERDVSKFITFGEVDGLRFSRKKKKHTKLFNYNGRRVLLTQRSFYVQFEGQKTTLIFLPPKFPFSKMQGGKLRYLNCFWTIYLWYGRLLNWCPNWSGLKPNILQETFSFHD